MGIKRESLEQLRSKIDLVEVLQPYVEIKRNGGVWKGLCPFHDEKTPSFVIHKEDQHYHCYGCGAHGDAIAFLMQMQKLHFSDAVRVLADQFHVSLEEEKKEALHGPPSKTLKEANRHAADFFHNFLLHTKEGIEAQEYLAKRGILLPFIEKFELGLAPSQGTIFLHMMGEENINPEILITAGLAFKRGQRDLCSFFSDRIVFPICDAMGSVIGFSGRKFREKTEGGKYVNTPETPLFKKSKILFGLSFSRRKMAKERRAILVEGQIDALRLIDEGLDYTVATQGTAFGEAHAELLASLGVQEVFLAMDNDPAGQEATKKAGGILQGLGIAAKVIHLPKKTDPDSFIQDKGIQAFQQQMLQAEDFISFFVRHTCQNKEMINPAIKNQVVTELVQQIRSWKMPLLVHESLRRVAQILQIPEEMIGAGHDPIRQTYVRKMGSIEKGIFIHPLDVLEEDLLRWLLLTGTENPHLVALTLANLTPQKIHNPFCSSLYAIIAKHWEKGTQWDFLQLASSLDDAQGIEKFERLLQKKIKRERAEQGLRETINKILHYHWMEHKEQIRLRLQNNTCPETEALALAKEFAEIQKNPPQLIEALRDSAVEGLRPSNSPQRGRRPP